MAALGALEKGSTLPSVRVTCAGARRQSEHRAENLHDAGTRRYHLYRSGKRVVPFRDGSALEKQQKVWLSEQLREAVHGAVESGMTEKEIICRQISGCFGKGGSAQMIEAKELVKKFGKKTALDHMSFRIGGKSVFGLGRFQRCGKIDVSAHGGRGLPPGRRRTSDRRRCAVRKFRGKRPNLFYFGLSLFSAAVRPFGNGGMFCRVFIPVGTGNGSTK